MAKRFTDTNLWKNQRWFRKLKPEYKLAFIYIKDQCDHAGIWRIDCADLVEDLGFESFDIEDFIEKCNTEFDKQNGGKIKKERILTKGNILWLTGFIQFQYENKSKEISIKAAPVRTALLTISAYGFLPISLIKGYITLEQGLYEKYLSLNDNYLTLKKDLQEGYTTPKDKDKDKEHIGENKKLKGVKFDEFFENVFFEDGSSQILGREQSVLARDKCLKPFSVIKGHIY